MEKKELKEKIEYLEMRFKDKAEIIKILKERDKEFKMELQLYAKFQPLIEYFSDDKTFFDFRTNIDNLLLSADGDVKTWSVFQILQFSKILNMIFIEKQKSKNNDNFELKKTIKELLKTKKAPQGTQTQSGANFLQSKENN